MPDTSPHDDLEVDLPAVEAVIAGTLALMTGYGQALQADLHPAQRLCMGAKVAQNLGLLSGHPQLSDEFRRVLDRLAQRWQWITGCTQAAQADAARSALPAAAGVH